LGSYYNGVSITTAPVNTSNYSIITIGTAGVYLFTFGITQTYTGTLGTTNYVVLQGTNALSQNYGAQTIISVINGQISFGGSQVVTCTASVYNIGLATNSTYGVPGAVYFHAIRIG
jgi:hypothetical protein